VQLWNARTAKRSELRPLRRLILILHAVLVTGNVCRLFRARHPQVRIPHFSRGERRFGLLPCCLPSTNRGTQANMSDERSAEILTEPQARNDKEKPGQLFGD